MKEISQIILDRRSIFPKSYSGEKIDDSIIEQLLENARWAPTHRKTEPWRFKVFSDAGVETLVNFLQARDLGTTALDQDNPKLEKYNVLRSNVSHVLAISMHRDPAALIPEWEEIASVAMAIQNIYLSLASHGLGGYWSTGFGLNADDTRDFLQLSDNERHLGWFFLGKLADDAMLPKGIRTEMADKVIWRKS